MQRLIKELRRREVFRTAGLYVGVSWILIEGASVMLPAFDAPEWALRAVILVAIIGLPVVIVLAWFYDVTESGIEVQADPTDTVILPFGKGRRDFAVMAVLVVALTFSVFLNIKGSGSVVVEAIELIHHSVIPDVRFVGVHYHHRQVTQLHGIRHSHYRCAAGLHFYRLLVHGKIANVFKTCFR